METIIITILIALVGWFVTIRYKEVSQKRVKFNEEYFKFSEPLLHFAVGIQDKKVALNYALSTTFKTHRLLKDVFIRNLKGKRLKKFNEKWTQYEEQYQEVNSLGVFGIGAAIPPNLEALHKAGPDDPPKWEADRKQKIHSIITELLKIAKIKIWF